MQWFKFSNSNLNINDTNLASAGTFFSHYFPTYVQIICCCVCSCTCWSTVNLPDKAWSQEVCLRMIFWGIVTYAKTLHMNQANDQHAQSMNLDICASRVVWKLKKKKKTSTRSLKREPCFYGAMYKWRFQWLHYNMHLFHINVTQSGFSTLGPRVMWMWVSELPLPPLCVISIQHMIG